MSHVGYHCIRTLNTVKKIWISSYIVYNEIIYFIIYSYMPDVYNSVGPAETGAPKYILWGVCYGVYGRELHTVAPLSSRDCADSRFKWRHQCKMVVVVVIHSMVLSNKPNNKATSVNINVGYLKLYVKCSCFWLTSNNHQQKENLLKICWYIGGKWSP